MILFPYRAQIKLHKWPVMTIAVSVVCLLIYYLQSGNEQRLEDYTTNFCAHQMARESNHDELLEEGNAPGWKAQCSRTLLGIYTSTRPEHELTGLTKELAAQGNDAEAEH